MTATETQRALDARPVMLEASWKLALQDEFDAEYMSSLSKFLQHEKASGKRIFPPGKEIFRAFNATPLEAVKIVILGQDPYHGESQAHGLCFSVKPGIDTPPSLLNIYKELGTDVGFKPPPHGCLSHWARQGVLLLNAVLTVEAGRAASHQGQGWERFTDQVVNLLNQKRNGLVFLLWGAYAQKKGAIIDRSRHLVLQSPHPSPLSASRGFFGNRHFSRANDYLLSIDKSPVDWQLPAEVQASHSEVINHE